MSFYKTELFSDIHDVDYNGVARASSIMRYIQSSAQLQLTENGLSYEQLKESKRAFILSKIRLDISEPVYAYEKLSAETFPCQSRGYSFLRCYRLTGGGRVIARAASVWALINTETRALVRVDDFNLGLPTLPPLDLSVGHISLPGGLLRVGAYHVNYEASDQNGHMNNNRYPDMYSNYLPLDKKRIKTIAINYMKEAPMGEKLDVFRAEYNGTYFFKTVRADGEINTIAEITLADI